MVIFPIGQNNEQLEQAFHLQVIKNILGSWS